MPAGRPAKKKEDILQVLELISSGMSIRQSCEQLKMSSRTFMDYILKPEYAQHYARAMEKRADAIFDQITDIADNPDPDADVQRDRLRVDARKWVVSKMLPKKYGDKITQELTGADGAKLMPEKIIIEIVDPKKPKKG
jgi:hypothetical protein